METAISCAVEDEILELLNIDLDDDDRPRSLRECVEQMPGIIAACDEEPDAAHAEAVCDWCRSLLAAHLRERGKPADVRRLLENSLAAISRASEHLPRERTAHFVDNIRFRIEVTNVLEKDGEAAVLELLAKRQVAMAQRLINPAQTAEVAVPPCPTLAVE